MVYSAIDCQHKWPHNVLMAFSMCFCIEHNETTKWPNIAIIVERESIRMHSSASLALDRRRTKIRWQQNCLVSNYDEQIKHAFMVCTHSSSRLTRPARTSSILINLIQQNCHFDACPALIFTFASDRITRAECESWRYLIGDRKFPPQTWKNSVGKPPQEATLNSSTIDLFTTISFV